MGVISSGSSPLARGTLLFHHLVDSVHGLIPARAGNTGLQPGCDRALWAHPRSRGEHRYSSVKTPRPGGSSPLARGTRRKESTGDDGDGLIPARAGNTVTVSGRPAMSWAHPRSRGEHRISVEWSHFRVGSSPLARGTPVDAFTAACGSGLIPARAGNTSGYALPGGVSRAHPRSRGEHLAIFPLMSVALGSSPLARGTR